MSTHLLGCYPAPIFEDQCLKPNNAFAGATVVPIPDVQGSADTRQIAINKVGIKDLHHPVQVQDRHGHRQTSVANFSMYVNLEHAVKGTHMSRFLELLNDREPILSVESFPHLLAQMTERLEAQRGYIEVSFPFFVNKSAPISGVQSLMDYEVSLFGELQDGVASLSVQVIVPVTSLCPCSKKISRHGAHSQRSHVTIKARLQGTVWIEELIELAEQEASCELYGLLKRPDEKYITERAYENPKFVEDIVRDIAARLNQDERIAAYRVATENFESIHNHSAYALIEFDKTRAS